MFGPDSLVCFAGNNFLTACFILKDSFTSADMGEVPSKLGLLNFLTILIHEGMLVNFVEIILGSFDFIKRFSPCTVLPRLNF
jgi:hypothetical protein